jgi:hypothetical protein
VHQHEQRALADAVVADRLAVELDRLHIWNVHLFAPSET